MFIFRCTVFIAQKCFYHFRHKLYTRKLTFWKLLTSFSFVRLSSAMMRPCRAEKECSPLDLIGPSFVEGPGIFVGPGLACLPSCFTLAAAILHHSSRLKIYNCMSIVQYQHILNSLHVTIYVMYLKNLI